MSSGVELDLLNTTGSKADTVSVVDRSTPSQYGDRNHNSLSLNSEHPPPARTPKQVTRERIQFLSLCWTIFLVGWNDGSTGPLLPRIQGVYGVSYVVVSLIFVFACVVGVMTR